MSIKLEILTFQKKMDKIIKEREWAKYSREENISLLILINKGLDRYSFQLDYIYKLQ